ncbi:Calcyclin-binding protein-like protein [Dioscorea alata]|uniref:Calcyclin-binding protein-like protein n=1 Tax=Dioscorea alata TaxID=55571 RepID=A0ACB7TUZ9_DIOAL|nr:Calcyclin-binding protein-like protein [Dioscorea alata]
MAEEQRSELGLDLEELRHLEAIAKRPRVLNLLSSEIRSIDSKLSKASAAVATQTPTVIARDKAPVDAATAGVLNYVTLSSFSWDQDNEKVKIYVFLEGVEQEKAETIFKSMSVDIKFHDVQGKNYRLAIPKLNKEIVPEKCKVLVKPTKVIVTLFKASKGNWLDLHLKEDKTNIETGSNFDGIHS